jgi:neurotransmitter:Na+ symporter, NSS family
MSKTAQWSSQWGFILAASGAAVGLGNIWKFPYIAGENGGGAFVLVYLLCVFLIGAPIIIAEIMLGRRGKSDPIHAMKSVAKDSKRSKHWQWVGILGVFTGFLVLSYYSVIAGTALDYVYQAGAGHFTNASATRIDLLYDQVTHNPWLLLALHSIIMIVTIWIVARGVNKGIEFFAKWLFPIMFLLLLVLVFYAYANAYFFKGLYFLFHPNFHALSANAVLIALGHAFFTLSIAIGSMMVYGAYLPERISIGKVALCVVLIDTLVALIAGVAIFPIVFQHGLKPGAGPGLIFETLPIAFGHMALGRLMASVFFIMLTFAAITSTISLLEPTVAWLLKITRLKRGTIAFLSGFLIWFIGIGTVLSFNLWQHDTLFGETFFDALDYLTANIMLPVGGLLITFFVGWRMDRELIKASFYTSNTIAFKTWFFLTRYLAPIAIIFVFLSLLKIV